MAIPCTAPGIPAGAAPSSSALIDVLPYGRQEKWQDSPGGWPQSPTYSRWAGSEGIAAVYGPAE